MDPVSYLLTMMEGMPEWIRLGNHIQQENAEEAVTTRISHKFKLYLNSRYAALEHRRQKQQQLQRQLQQPLHNRELHIKARSGESEQKAPLVALPIDK